MKFLIIAGCTLFCQLFKYEKHTTNTYCNARFGYCINYPDFLIPQEESANGDGRIFNNAKNQKVLTVFGRLNQDANGDPIPLKKQYNSDIQALKSSHCTIAYQKLGIKFYVLSGLQDGKIFYRKIIEKEDSYCYAILEYEKSAKAIYDSASVDIFKSFK